MVPVMLGRRLPPCCCCRCCLCCFGLYVFAASSNRPCSTHSSQMSMIWNEADMMETLHTPCNSGPVACRLVCSGCCPAI